MLAISTKPVHYAQGLCSFRNYGLKNKPFVDQNIKKIAGNTLCNLPVDSSKQFKLDSNWLDKKLMKSLYLKAGEENRDAQYKLFERYVEINGLDPNVLDKFKEGVLSDDPRILLIMGKILMSGPYPDQGMRRVFLAAYMDDPEAHMFLGKCFEKGDHLPLSLYKALKHYQTAYDLGAASAKDDIHRLCGENSYELPLPYEKYDNRILIGEYPYGDYLGTNFFWPNAE